MTFKRDIPASTDKPSNSQDDLLRNFQVLDDSFAANHIGLTAAAADSGKHAFVVLPERDGTASAPYPTTGANEVALLSINSVGNTQPDLAFVPENTVPAGVAAAAVRLTGGGITAAAYCTFNGAGALVANSFNVSGVVRNSEGNFTISFARNFNNTNYIAMINPVMQNASNTGIGVRGYSPAVGSFTFDARVEGANSQINPQSVHCVFFGILV